ncbi:MAG TPA: MaoC family dehydratase N-terminal domain-containing protein [Solirubrobacteraceae bacterium]|nr:MaoC family dehydratase N-terminal domain-containing protein [Solirubrobacteraceae bacterium]
MTLATQAIGKRYEPVLYAVGREKVREFARAVGETDPLHLDVEAARAAGYADVVAPPMFAVVYAGAAMAHAVFDPELEIDFAHLVHGEQEFRWGPLVVAGDEIETVARLADVRERGGMTFYVFETASRNQAGERVCDGVWTHIVRPAS